MNTTIDFLDAVKAKLDLPSDYALSPVLGVTRQAISKYRNKHDFLGDEKALMVAQILEIEPFIVLAAVHAERAKSEPEKAAWKAAFEKLGGIAAAVVVGIMLNAPTPASASTGAEEQCKNQQSDLYIMRSEEGLKIRLIASIKAQTE